MSRKYRDSIESLALSTSVGAVSGASDGLAPAGGATLSAPSKLAASSGGGSEPSSAEREIRTLVCSLGSSSSERFWMAAVRFWVMALRSPALSGWWLPDEAGRGRKFGAAVISAFSTRWRRFGGSGGPISGNPEAREMIPERLETLDSRTADRFPGDSTDNGVSPESANRDADFL